MPSIKQAVGKAFRLGSKAIDAWPFGRMTHAQEAELRALMAKIDRTLTELEIQADRLIQPRG